MISYRRVKRTLKQLAGQDLWSRVQFSCLTHFYGDWCVCPHGIGENSIVYSLGVGTDVSFDEALINEFGVDIYAFDPTPNSAQWVNSVQLPPKFHFFEYGVANHDGAVTIYPRSRKGRTSKTMYTAIKDGGEPSEGIEVRMHKLKTIMKMLNHNQIDILKMDIEGSEYEVIDDLIDANIPIYQLLVEFHHRFESIGPAKTKHALQKLNACGYQIFAISETGREYSFINVSQYREMSS